LANGHTKAIFSETQTEDLTSIPKKSHLGKMQGTVAGLQPVIQKYAASFAIVCLAALIVSDLETPISFPKFSCFAAAVSWSFARLGRGPGLCALLSATLATDYWVIEPIYSISLNWWTGVAMASYAVLAFVVARFGSPSPQTD
jgi:hypothetical protein